MKFGNLRLFNKIFLTKFDEIISNAAAFGIGYADEKEIDEINILQATFLAMRRAVEQLTIPFVDSAFESKQIGEEAIINQNNLNLHFFEGNNWL